MKSVGIDIGSYSIKVVEIQTTSKGFQVNQYFEQKLSPAANADHELESIEFLRALTSKYDPTQTKFICCLRQDRVAIRNKNFPFSDRQKIFKSLPFELEEDIPFSVDNAIFDAKIIRTIGATAEVLACAAPKHYIEKALHSAQDMGIELSVLSTEGTSFANIIERWNEPPQALPGVSLQMQMEEPVRAERHINIVLNMGHTRTLVCAFENNILVGVRSIQWGGKNIAEAIARKYEIPYFEALKELETKAFILTNKQGATFDQVTFSETISQVTREMIRDLQLSILEFKAEFNANILGIDITGGVSQIQNLGAYLTQMLEVPVNKISALQNFQQVLFERNPAVECKLGMALGLAVEGLKKPRNPAINFLRGEFAKQNYKFQALWQKWNKTIQIGAAALLVLVVYANLRESISASLAERTQEVLKTQAKTVAKLTGKNATEANIKKYIRDNKKRAADLKTLSSLTTMNSAMDILKKISDATPAKSAVIVDMRRVSIEQNQVQVEGYVRSARELSILQQALVNITADGKVSPRPNSLSPLNGKTSFAFSFQVDRGIQKVTK